MVPFEVVIGEAHRDKDLADKLKRELSGVLNWALQGCLAWDFWNLSWFRRFKND
jgi:putative DNA primase/helicase